MMFISEAQNPPPASDESSLSAIETPGGVEVTPHRTGASPFRRDADGIDERAWNPVNLRIDGRLKERDGRADEMDVGW